MKNLAIIVAVASIIVNVVLWNQSHELDQNIIQTEAAEKECIRQIKSIERDHAQEVQFHQQIENDLKDKKKELENEIDQLLSQKDQLVEEKTRYFGENVGLRTSVEQLKQILSTQGRFEHYMEENFKLKGKLAEVDALLSVERQKNTALQQTLSKNRNLIHQLDNQLADKQVEIYQLEADLKTCKSDKESLSSKNRSLIQAFRHDVEQITQAFGTATQQSRKKDRSNALENARRISNEILQKYARP